jgi:hypothetical protein
MTLAAPFDTNMPARCVLMGCDCRSNRGSWGRPLSVVQVMSEASHSSCLAQGEAATHFLGFPGGRAPHRLATHNSAE